MIGFASPRVFWQRIISHDSLEMVSYSGGGCRSWRGLRVEESDCCAEPGGSVTTDIGPYFQPALRGERHGR